MDDFEPATNYEYNQLMNVLNQNKDKSFVKRILDPTSYPTLDLGNGSYATHRMAWTEADGKYFVYPTVLLDNGKLKDFGDEAWHHVRQTGNYIEMPSADDAEWFSTRYKAAWGGQMNRPPK